MKVRITLDEEIDVGQLGNEDYPFEQELKDSIKGMIKEEVGKRVRAAAKKHLNKWLTKEFGPEGKFAERDGVVYIPLMVKELKNG